MTSQINTSTKMPGAYELSDQSVLNRPDAFFRAIMNDFKGSWSLGMTFFLRDIKAQYRLSFLGLFWSIVPPLMFVIGFSAMSRAEIIDFGATPIPYPAFAMISVMIWHVFQESIEAPMLGFKEAKPLIGRMKFSVESVLISRIYMVLFNLFVKMLFVGAALVYFNVPVLPQAVFFNFPLMALICFGFFIGIVLAPLTFLIDDLAHGLKFLITFWMLLTPVAYVVPEDSRYYELMAWNPAASLISAVRETFLSLPLSYEGPFYIVSAAGLCGLLVAWLFAKISLPFITERAGTV